MACLVRHYVFWRSELSWTNLAYQWLSCVNCYSFWKKVESFKTFGVIWSIYSIIAFRDKFLHTLVQKGLAFHRMKKLRFRLVLEIVAVWRQFGLSHTFHAHTQPVLACILLSVLKVFKSSYKRKSIWKFWKTCLSKAVFNFAVQIFNRVHAMRPFRWNFARFLWSGERLVDPTIGRSFCWDEVSCLSLSLELWSLPRSGLILEYEMSAYNPYRERFYSLKDFGHCGSEMWCYRWVLHHRQLFSKQTLENPVQEANIDASTYLQYNCILREVNMSSKFWN